VKVKTIIEPFRVKVVEPIRMTTREERAEILERAHHNLFLVKAEDVLIDLLTDSGTSAMSAQQWSAMAQGDESYAGARSYYRFEEVVRDLTGFEHIIPTHQGRAAERILFGVTAREGMVVPNNTHFDTTGANCEASGAKALDLPCAESASMAADFPFKGNMDLGALERVVAENGPQRIPMIMVTVTNNSGGGQPVSLENMHAVAKIAKAAKIPLYLDACRFAENAYLIKEKEPGQGDRTVIDIAREMFGLADGCTMSAKKDALVNIGGFVATRDNDIAQQMRNLLILTEGFTTYGGMAGRDLEAIATGLQEIVDEDYLRYRLASIRYVVDRLAALGIPVLQPAGGHAIYLDARAFLPHIPPLQFPGQALSAAIYLEGGIRSVEIGQVMFGRVGGGEEKLAPKDLVRMAVPRRVYTQSHMDYALEILAEVWRRREEIRGYKLTYQAPMLRHFTANFEHV
jgi:tyrosine phenol-lyase